MKASLVAVALLLVTPVLNAQTRCECEYDDWVDDCDAEFVRRENWITFKSNTEQCSRIDWYTDAQPRLTIVEDGRETIELIGIPNDAEISIASCKVCKDKLFDNDPSRSKSDMPPENSSAPIGGSLVLSFSGDCWTEVTDASGRRVFFGLGRAGEQKALAGTAPFKVLVGDSRSVSITRNGQRVAIPAGDGPARLTIR